MNETSQTENNSSAPARVECRATSDPAVRLFILAAMPLAFGVWCLIDRHKHPWPETWDLPNINAVGGYLLNNWGPFVLFPLGLVVLYFAVRFVRRVLVADEEGIGYAGKDKVRWEDVSKLDAAELKKEILVLESGGQAVLKLDGWKLRNFRDLVAFIERRVPADKWIRPEDDSS